MLFSKFAFTDVILRNGTKGRLDAVDGHDDASRLIGKILQKTKQKYGPIDSVDDDVLFAKVTTLHFIFIEIKHCRPFKQY